VDFLTGMTNLTNWIGNVIMPTLAGLFLVFAILRAARNAPFQYAMYAGFLSLMVSGLLRAIETMSRQRAWNDPDQVWVTLLGLVNWSANVFLPVYGVLQVVMALLHYGGATHSDRDGLLQRLRIAADGRVFRPSRHGRNQLGGLINGT
jgi:hypothetical protein